MATIIARPERRTSKPPERIDMATAAIALGAGSVEATRTGAAIGGASALTGRIVVGWTCIWGCA